ncbi:SRPBCC family protein [Nibrella saemangeumensis]|uniref:SRPBCC family protein n=1 Tax=Nibrella saemangeumensis TaxID=1084526 RepID=A0ABP8N2W0_9BACT
MKDAYSPILRNQRMNVGPKERIFSAVGGSWLLLDAFAKREASIPEAMIGGYLLFRGVTGYCPLHSAIEKRQALEVSDNINIHVDLVVNRSPMEVYDFWRKLENLPLFMSHIEYVRELDAKTSEWKATGPGGIGSLTWKAEIVKEERGRLLGWRSLPGAAIENAGKVELLYHPDGTQLHVIITYKAPLGVPGKEISRLLNPMFRDIVKEDVLNVKSYLETGTLAAS